MPIRTGLPQDVVDRLIESIPVEHRTRAEINATIDAHIAATTPRAARRAVTNSTLVNLYTVDHLTTREIGFRVGMSPQAVYKRLQGLGIKREQGTWITRECSFCGNIVRKRRGEDRKRAKIFCNTACMFAARESPGYKPWRQGQRLARAIVAQRFALPPGAVVHHKDGDNRNNDLSNLSVYADNSEHLKSHHTKTKVESIWDGASVRR